MLCCAQAVLMLHAYGSLSASLWQPASVGYHRVTMMVGGVQSYVCASMLSTPVQVQGLATVKLHSTH